MAQLEKLTGGFINEVSRVDGVVIKNFTGDKLVKVASNIRFKREQLALLRFGGNVAPTYIGEDGQGKLLQEFINGQSAETTVGLDTFKQAGELLRVIHHPVTTNFDYWKDGLERKWDNARSIAFPILKHEGVEVNLKIDWAKVARLGVCRVHRDFWLGNIISRHDSLVAVDWEFAGIGIPYEDFAIVELWIFNEYEKQFPNCRRDFWQGYQLQPDDDLVKEFLKAKCLEFLSTTSCGEYQEEKPDGFYHNKINALRDLA